MGFRRVKKWWRLLRGWIFGRRERERTGAVPESAPSGPVSESPGRGRRFWLLDVEKRGETVEEIALAEGLAGEEVHEWKRGEGCGASEFLGRHLQGSDVLVGHNIADFDVPVLAALHGPVAKLTAIDTLSLSRFSHPFLPSRRLFDLLRCSSVAEERYRSLVPHRARDDVRANFLLMGPLGRAVEALHPLAAGLLKTAMGTEAFDALAELSGFAPDAVTAEKVGPEVLRRLWERGVASAVGAFRKERDRRVEEEAVRLARIPGTVAVEANDAREELKLVLAALASGRKGFVLCEDALGYARLFKTAPELELLVPWVARPDECWCLKRVEALAERPREAGPHWLHVLGVACGAPFPGPRRSSLFSRAMRSPEPDFASARRLLARLAAPAEGGCDDCSYESLCGKRAKPGGFFPLLAVSPDNLPQDLSTELLLWTSFHPLSDRLGADPRFTLDFPDLSTDPREEGLEGLADFFRGELKLEAGETAELELELFRGRFGAALEESARNSAARDHPFWRVLLHEDLPAESFVWARVSADPLGIRLRGAFTDLAAWMSKLAASCETLLLSGMGLCGPEGAEDGPLAFPLGLKPVECVRKLRPKGTLSLYGLESVRPPGPLGLASRAEELLGRIEARDDGLQLLCSNRGLREVLARALGRFHADRAVVLAPENRERWPREREKIREGSLILTSFRQDLRRPGPEKVLWAERLPYPSPHGFPWSARMRRLVEAADTEARMARTSRLVPFKAALDFLFQDLRLQDAQELEVHLLDPRWKPAMEAAGSLLEGCFRVQRGKDLPAGVLSSSRREWLRERLGGGPGGMSFREARELLARIWGHGSFKSYGGFDQWDVIRTVTEGRDFFMVVSTGGGKSVCFQIPAFHWQKDYPPSLALVVSPLQALMDDQVRNLEDRGVFSATFVHSALSPAERRRRLSGIRHGLYSLVYLAPEQLRNERTVEAVLSRETGFLAIDEAHTLSQWGHDFRTDFFYIKPFLEDRLLGGRPRDFPVLAATATAKAPSRYESRMESHARRDVVSQLGLRVREGESFRVGTTHREELVFDVEDLREPREASAEKARWEDVDERKARWLLRELPGGRWGRKGIVYCAFAATTEALAAVLQRDARLDAAPFNGKMDSGRKDRVLAWFRRPATEGKVKVLAATNAFGMGIDVADIGFVVHHELPANLEAYYQEAGRACRDPRRVGLGRCALLYHPSDAGKQRLLLRSNQFTFREIGDVQQWLARKGKGRLTVPAAYLAGAAGVTEDRVHRILFYLEYRSLYRANGEILPLVRFKGVRNRTIVLKMDEGRAGDDAEIRRLAEELAPWRGEDGLYRAELGRLKAFWGLQGFDEAEGRLRSLQRAGRLRIEPRSFVEFLAPLEEGREVLQDLVSQMMGLLAQKGAAYGKEVVLGAAELAGQRDRPGYGRRETLTASVAVRLLRGMRIEAERWLDDKSLRVEPTRVRFKVLSFDQGKLLKTLDGFCRKVARHIHDPVRPGRRYPLDSLDLYPLRTRGFFDLLSILEERGLVDVEWGEDFAGRCLDLEVPVREVAERRHLDLAALYGKHGLDEARLQAMKRYAETVAALPAPERNEAARRFIADYFEGREDVAPAVESPHRLSPRQLEAVACDGPLHVEGTAGCGKSEIVVHKVRHLQMRAVPLDGVVVTAHSSHGARNLEDRYRELFGGGARFRVVTVHALGMGVVRRSFRRLGYRSVPSLAFFGAKELDWVVERLPGFCRDVSRRWIAALAGDHEADKGRGKTVEKTFLHYWLAAFPDEKIRRDGVEAAARAPFRPLEMWTRLVSRRPPRPSSLDALKDPRSWADAALLRRALDELGGMEEGEGPPDIHAFCRLCLGLWLENLLLDHNRITFADQVLLGLRALELFPDVARQARGSYDHALVDEYQDLSGAQLKLLEALFDQANLAILGDANQAIYEDGEANARAAKRFLFGRRHARVVRLDVTYRSTNQIIRMAHKLVDKNWKELPEARRGDGEPVWIWLPDGSPGRSPLDGSLFFQAIFREMERLWKKDPEGTVLVTAHRKDGDLRRFVDFLAGKRGFQASTQVKLGADPLKNPSNRGLRKWLETVHRPSAENVADLLGLHVTPYLDGGEMEELKGILDEGGGIGAWRSKVASRWKNAAQKKRMESLLKLLGRLEEGKERLTVSWLLQSLERAGGAALGGSPRPSLVLSRSHPHYFTVRPQRLSLNPERIVVEDWLETVFGSAEEAGDRRGRARLTIGNIHQIKGEEYSHVFVLGFGAPAEQKQLYVALTRAEARAYLCFADARATSKALKAHRCVQGADYAVEKI